MNPIHAITDRLGNKGTLALLAVLAIGTFALLDHLHLTAASPRVTMLEDAWQAYDRAALSRDAPQRAFDHAIEPLNKQMPGVEALTNHLPELDETAQKTFHNSLANLRECQAWLQTYRQFVPVTDADPNPVRDNARDHIDACTDAHPIKPYPPGMLPNDDAGLPNPHL